MKGVNRIAMWAVVAAVWSLALAGCGGKVVPTPTVSGQPPMVAILAPAGGATVQNGQTVEIQSQAMDDKGVVRMELWVDGVLTRSDASAQAGGYTPFAVSQPWRPAVPGSHAVMVKAYDADGLVGESAVLLVSVQDTAVGLITPTGEPAVTPLPTTPLPEATATPTSEPTATPTSEPTAQPTATPTVAPTATPTVAPIDALPKVQLLSPASPYHTSPGSEVTLRIKATDDKGVTRIELWADGQLYRKDEVGGGKSVTWEMHWVPPALGTYILEAKALDTKFQLSAVARLEVRVATPTPACSGDVDPALANAWSQAKLGCPSGPSAIVWSAWEPFQRGNMLWRQDSDWAYVLHWRNGTNPAAGDWQTGGAAWKWDGSFPDGHGLTPPAGLYEPIRGFGFVWFNYLGGPASSIGWGTDEEKGFCARIQAFERGTIVRSTKMASCDGNYNRGQEPSFNHFLIAMYNDKNWEGFAP